MILKSDMPSISVEQSQIPQNITPDTRPIEKRDNREVLGKRDPDLAPITDAAVNDELQLLRDLSNNQNDLSKSSPISRMLGGTKNIVIYFNQNTNRANNDNINISAPGLVNSTKYDRIDNMIIFTEQELQANFTVEDGHVDNQVTSSGVMPAGTTPKSGDLFYWNDIGGRGVLFVVTNPVPLSTLEYTGWQIEFQRHHEQFTPEELTNLVQDYFVFKFENLGTDRVVVLHQKMAHLYDMATKILEDFTNEYIFRFFDEPRNIIRLKHLSKKKQPSQYVVLGEEHKFQTGGRDDIPELPRQIFDPYIMQFFSDAFAKEKLLYKGYSIYPVNPVWTGEEFKTYYHHSIYNAIIHQKPSLILYYYNLPIPFNPSTLRDLSFENWYYFELIANEDPRCIDIFPRGLLGRIVKNSLYNVDYGDDKEMLKYNLIIKYCNIKGYIPTKEDLDPFSKEIDLMDDTSLYGIGPIIMYICYNFRQTVGKRFT